MQKLGFLPQVWFFNNCDKCSKAQGCFLRKDILHALTGIGKVYDSTLRKIGADALENGSACLSFDVLSLKNLVYFGKHDSAYRQLVGRVKSISAEEYPNGHVMGMYFRYSIEGPMLEALLHLALEQIDEMQNSSDDKNE